MKLLNKMERKFGKYAIPNLMKYIIVLYGVGLLIGTLSPYFYETYFSLNFSMVMKGQVWRLVTFIIPNVSFRDILFIAIKAYLYYMIGNSLEQAWGAFRFNLYFFSGVLFNVLAAGITYAFTKVNVSPSFEYVYGAMFFAFAALYPETKFYLYFLIPVKVKWLAWLYAALDLYTIFTFAANGYYFDIIPIVVSMANFLIFFFVSRNYKKMSPKEFQRKAKFHKQMNEGRSQGNDAQFQGRNVITRHKCAVCGRTELDNDQLEFRFCSKCEGNYEYCMDHLFTHEHVKS